MGTISIILCSHNGERLLPDTLDSLAALDLPSPTQLILVDNASTDRTWEILQRPFERFDVIRLQEPRRGKSLALNLALERAAGDLIVFTDDDTTRDPDWLTAYLDAGTHHPEALCFAGQVRPNWSATPARWQEYIADHGGAFGCSKISFNDRVQPIDASQVKGANFAIRGAARALRFDTERLNYGQEGAGGEDTHFASRAGDLGHPILFVPDAVVRHLIEPEDMSIGSVLGRTRSIGRSRWQRLRLQGEPPELELRRARRRFRKAVKNIFRSRSRPEMVFWLLKAVFWRAQIKEARNEAATPAASAETP
ncbi:glycosyltransferase [Aestuariibius sp. 2305UL40-4]|uniref:glycosyltransferase n=1 Tax=Aestuariibius violaceus TaxID=3234132 RepID=UPI00345E3037